MSNAEFHETEILKTLYSAIKNPQRSIGVTKSLHIKRLSNNAVVPTRTSVYSTGLDLYSTCSQVIPPNQTASMNTDIAICLPCGTYGRIADRSCMASKGLIVGGGVIDPDYEGPIKVILHNLNSTEYKVEKGDRIAQLICEDVTCPDVIVFEVDKTRGNEGLGSSGK